MPRSYNSKEATEFLFGDTVIRLATLATVEEAKRSGMLPSAITPNISALEISNISPLLNHPGKRYFITYQPHDNAPIVRAGVTAWTGIPEPFVDLQHTIWLANEATIHILLGIAPPITVDAAHIKTEYRGFLVSLDCTNNRGQSITRVMFDTLSSPHNLKITTFEQSLFGTVPHEQIFNAHAPIPDLPDWPKGSISLAAARLLDRERVTHLIGAFPTLLPHQWYDLDPFQALEELSRLIITTNGS